MKRVMMIFSLVFLLTGSARAEMGPGEAFQMTRDLEETRLFYELIGREECVEVIVERPCDSEWVTCIDDAWVVRYFVKEECPEAHEQLTVVWVVGRKKGEIISRYPEKPYFEDRRFCMEDFDCFEVSPAECANFLYARLEEGEDARPGCGCQAQQCVPVAN